MAGSKRHVFTSESVTEGHPDKVADQISDAVLDAILSRDPAGRVACETLVTTGMAVVAGEITTTTYVHIPDLVRRTVDAIGYTDASYGMDGRTCAVLTSIDRQSPDIAMGVDTGGAGDQGMMFGYATDETAELMPMPILLAHRITERLAECRRSGAIKWLRPDGKAQVTVVYEDKRPVAVDTVVVSTQHADDVSTRRLRNAIVEEIIEPNDQTVARREHLDGLRELVGNVYPNKFERSRLTGGEDTITHLLAWQPIVDATHEMADLKATLAEGERPLGLVHDRRRDLTRDDAAEQAAHRFSLVTQRP